MAAAALGQPGTDRLAELVQDALAWPEVAVDVGLVETAGGVRSPQADDGAVIDLVVILAPDRTSSWWGRRPARDHQRRAAERGGTRRRRLVADPGTESARPPSSSSTATTPVGSPPPEPGLAPDVDAVPPRGAPAGLASLA